MPYRDNSDLPPSVRHHLSEHAQDIYCAASNHAFAPHAGEERQEEAAHRIAWAAIKRSYVKVGANGCRVPADVRPYGDIGASGAASPVRVARGRCGIGGPRAG